MKKKLTKALSAFLVVLMLFGGTSFLISAEEVRSVKTDYLAQPNYRIKNKKVVSYLTYNEPAYSKYSKKTTSKYFYYYDESGRIKKETFKSSDNNSYKKVYLYYPNGNVKKATLKKSNYENVVYTYYENGLLKTSYKSSPSGSQFSTSYYYNDKNELTHITNINNGIMSEEWYVYDDNGNLVEKNCFDSKSLVMTPFSYDYKFYNSYLLGGKPMTVTCSKSTDEGKQVVSQTSFSYSPRKKLLCKATEDDNMVASIWNYTYDNYGRVTSVHYFKDAFGDSDSYTQENIYNYNNDGKLEKHSYQDSEEGCFEETFIYDKNGNRIKKECEDSGDFIKNTTTTYTYEKLKLGEKEVTDGIFVRLSEKKFTYDGSKKKPAVIFSGTDGTNELVEGRDYTVSYSKNKDIGKGKVKIKYIGDYQDIYPTTLYFKIVK